VNIAKTLIKPQEKHSFQRIKYASPFPLIGTIIVRTSRSAQCTAENAGPRGGLSSPSFSEFGEGKCEKYRRGEGGSRARLTNLKVPRAEISSKRNFPINSSRAQNKREFSLRILFGLATEETIIAAVEEEGRKKIKRTGIVCALYQRRRPLLAAIIAE